MEHGEISYLSASRECLFCGDWVFTMKYSEHCGQYLCIQCWLDEDAFFKKTADGETQVTSSEATS